MANFILLRGGAKSLVEIVEDGPRLAKAWEGTLKALLGNESEEEGCFLLQHHASVSLISNLFSPRFLSIGLMLDIQLAMHNLVSGCTDERPQRLFEPCDWIY